MIEWLLSGVTIAGVVLNTLKFKESFLVWIVGNVGWTVWALQEQVYGQLPMFLVFFVLNVWGYVNWSRKEASEYEL